MKKNYLLRSLLLLTAIAIVSCTSQDSADDYLQVSPVVLDITQVPYPKLSDYKFFTGDIKNLEPAYKVLPYKPNSELFSDYAHKKRFVWMPSGAQATYDGDDNVLEFPVGSVLIKSFYYDNVLPGNTTQIIETRLLIKTAEATPENSGWQLYDYIWNAEQTDAFLDVAGNGAVVPITFMENNVQRTIDYRVPSDSQCITCHKLIANGNETMVPIGPKPQNLNYSYNYGSSTQNQLQRWQAEGYLDNSIPEFVNSVVDYKDTSKSLELRARSYIDINCAHCHRDGAHCDYVPQRFNFSNGDLQTLGVCIAPSDQIPGYPFIINAGHASESEMIYRMNSAEESIMMPIIGRTVIHDEGVQLISDWINSLEECH